MPSVANCHYCDESIRQPLGNQVPLIANVVTSGSPSRSLFSIINSIRNQMANSNDSVLQGQDYLPHTTHFFDFFFILHLYRVANACQICRPILLL
ncbi:Uncharacterized protein APZ42_020858 [Daphnia magna]|uniref:Uncharacterized protein n=1 Tax=Daphnia magna TaxID=35525 RepID=A0A164XFF4_9CRUS|nr:Uncharacterized protein APZ42_020858 [Daphnia magna]